MSVYNISYSDEIWNQVNQQSKDLLNDFILELRQRRLSNQTIYQYTADLKGFMCYVFSKLNNRSILELTKKDYRNYSLNLIDIGKVSNARHNRVLSVIRSLLDYAENDDTVNYDNNAARRVRGLSDEPVKEIVFLKDDLILSTRDKLTDNGEFQKAALLMLAYDSAGRKGELIQVNKYSFLDLVRHNTNKVVGKGRKYFILLYFLGTQYSVQEWLKNRGDDDVDSLWVVGHGKEKRPATIQDLYDWFISMRKYLDSLNGKEINFTPHSMRHSALTNYSNGTHYVCRQMHIHGFSIDKLRLIAHHDSINTTQSYLPDTSNDELEKMFNITMTS